MNIGKLERVTNLRAIWETEPRFSDWLVSEEGLETVARDLEVQMENARREVRPGDYPCDVVGHVLGDENHVVIIENQFGRTDHDHLGKLMTYAAVNRATTAIWIAEDASDDHRSVIDWLNDNTPPHLNFFLACVRVFRIGDSPVAPQLEVVSRPNTEVKAQRTQTAAQQREIHGWRQQLWAEIHAYIARHNPPFRLQSPGVDHWSSIALGRSGFYLAMLLNTQRRCVAIEFVAAPSNWRDAAYQQLQVRRERIEAQLGASPTWECKSNSKRARIFLETALDPRDEANLGAIQAWFNEMLPRFHTCFSPIVRELVPSSTSASGGEWDAETEIGA